MRRGGNSGTTERVKTSGPHLDVHVGKQIIGLASERPVNVGIERGTVKALDGRRDGDGGDRDPGGGGWDETQ